jgi:O-antigen ligase
LIGGLNVYFDFRSMGLMCLMVGAILLAATRSRSGVLKVSKRVLVITAALCAVLLTFGYVMTQDEYRLRRSGSNSWRLGSFVAITKGIMRSPVIGNGSMATDPEMEAWHEEGMQDSSAVHALLGKNGGFSAHSQVLQAWYEGGICAVPFFVYFGFLLVKTLNLLIRRKVNNLSGLCLFIIVYVLWALVLSPLAGEQRILIATGMALICFLQDEELTSRIAAGFLPLNRLERGKKVLAAQTGWRVDAYRGS